MLQRGCLTNARLRACAILLSCVDLAQNQSMVVSRWPYWVARLPKKGTSPDSATVRTRGRDSQTRRRDLRAGRGDLDQHRRRPSRTYNLAAKAPPGRREFPKTKKIRMPRTTRGSSRE